MFDTLHSRHSSESRAVWPVCGVARRCTKTGSGGKFCVVSDSLMCGSLTLAVMCHCVGLGTWVPGYRIFVVNTSSGYKWSVRAGQHHSHTQFAARYRVHSRPCVKTGWHL